MSWFKRLITLPKSRNSVDDILGRDLAAVLKWSARTSILREFARVEERGLVSISSLATEVEEAVLRALGGQVPYPVRILISDAIASGLAEATGANLSAKLLAVQQQLFRALKL